MNRPTSTNDPPTTDGTVRPDDARIDRTSSPTTTEQGAAPTPPRTVTAPRHPAASNDHEVTSS